MKIRFGLVLSFALFIMTSMTSCVREYICQCQITYSGHAALPDSSVNNYTIKDTRNKAKKLCEQNSYEATKENVHTVEKCQLY
jgi:hypothetical protein